MSGKEMVICEWFSIPHVKDERMPGHSACLRARPAAPAQLSEALDLLPPADRSDRYSVKLPRETYDRLRALLGGVWSAPPGTPVVEHSALATVLDGATLRDCVALAGQPAPTAPTEDREALRAAALRALRALSSPSGDARPAGEVNEHEDLSFKLVRPSATHICRELKCANCGNDLLSIVVADNGQWDISCPACRDAASLLSEVLAKLR